MGTFSLTETLLHKTGGVIGYIPTKNTKTDTTFVNFN